MKVDYLSSSFPGVSIESQLDFVRDHIDPVFGTAKSGGGRAPYSKSLRWDGLALWYGSHGVLYEFTGLGCRKLYGNLDLFSFFLRQKVNRLDIAIDYTDGTTMSSIVAGADYSSHILSSTGETYYFGSPKSDVMVRVYRYNPPHDRAGIPRVEYVFRRDYAQRVATAILDGDNEAIIAGLAKIADRRRLNIHVDRASMTAKPMRLWDGMAKSTSKTETWLKKQVRPAIQKLIDNGATQEEIKQWLGL